MEFRGHRTYLKVTDALAGERDFTQGGGGNLKTATDENDNTTTFTYDGQERLERIIGALGTITRLTRNNKGHITRIAEALPEERQTDFSYDDNLRFTYDMLSRKVITQSACSETTADPFHFIA